MTKGEGLLKHQITIAKAVFVISLIVLIVLGSTIMFVRWLRTTPQSNGMRGQGWQRTPEIRIVMDSTADWARMMFNDFYGSHDNGIRIIEFRSQGWLVGNDSDDRIDAGFHLTFVDIIYNATVVKTGDIIGFFKGNNDFRHTRMYTDVVLEVNTDLMQIWVYEMLAGAGTTTFQLTNKQTGAALWQDTETGNSFTQYLRRTMSPGIFFATEQLGYGLIFVLVAGTVLIIVALNLVPLRRKPEPPLRQEDGRGILACR